MHNPKKAAQVNLSQRNHLQTTIGDHRPQTTGAKLSPIVSSIFRNVPRPDDSPSLKATNERR